MYRLLLIDDERMALVSLRHSFHWEEFGFTEICETTNPYDALALLESQRFDAAFVDIRMPELSGLDIIRQCCEQNIATNFVIITGYSDFNYAKQAIKLNVIDYCLKPIQPEDVSDLLPRLTNRIWADRLKQDTIIYNRLLTAADSYELLQYLGLNSSMRFLIVLEIFLSAENSCKGFAISDANLISLILGDHHILYFYSSETDISAYLEALVLHPETSFSGACTTVSGKFSLFSILKRLSTEAAAAYKHSEETGLPVLTALKASDCQNWNESFLLLLKNIDENYTTELSLSELSAKYSLNYTYCSTLFSQYTGTSFSKYLNTLRLNHARHIILTTDTPIIDISDHVGYNDHRHFEKSFKKEFKQTPSQLRKSTTKDELHNEKLL